MPSVPGATLFNRVASLTFGLAPGVGQNVTRLRIQFKIEKQDQPLPSSAEVKVWNLARTTRNAIVALADVPLILVAGYEASTGVIFNGDILPAGINITRSGPDWITSFKVADGGRSYQTDRVQISIPRGTPIRQAMAMVAATFKPRALGGIDTAKAIADLQSGKIPLIGPFQSLYNGGAVSGRSMDEFHRLCQANGLRATVVDGQLEVVPTNATMPSTAWPVELIPDLTPTTGLIGSPEPAKDGSVKIRCLLRPEIKPHRRVHVVCEAHPMGLSLRAAKVTHTGDTRGQDWYTDIEGTKVTA